MWLYEGPAAWHFVTLPKDESDQIRLNFGTMKRGWGSVPVLATIGATSWKTSIFPDKAAEAYLLPLKADVRKREHISAGDRIVFTLEIQV